MNAPVLVTADQVAAGAAQLVGLAVLAATIAALVAVGYRWATRERLPGALGLLVGIAGVTVYLATTSPVGTVLERDPVAMDAALFNVGAVVLAAAGAVVGYRVGDAFGRDALLDRPGETVDEEVSQLVRTVGRVVVVELPEDVADVVGYDPVPDRTRAAIAGSRFLFPRSLTVEELHARLVSRIKADYGVGTVDLELAADGTVEHLGVGRKRAGIGPTLPPATNAVVLRADPGFAASTGDLVQVWETGPPRRVLTGELRGAAGDVVTVAVNSADTPTIDPTERYRLVTLPVEDRPAREFASLLRGADETFASVTVEEDSPLDGLPVGALALTVVAARPDGATPVDLPASEYVISADEELFAVALPERLRRLERAAEARTSPVSTGIEGTDGTGGSSGPERGTEDPDGAAGGPDERTLPGDDSPLLSDAGGDEDSDPATDDDLALFDEDPFDAETADVGVVDDDPLPRDPFEETPGEDELFDDSTTDDDFLALQEGGETGGDEDAALTDDEPGEDEKGDEADDEPGDSSEESGTGASTFQQLKEEYESGEAEWADDVSDDPDGDVRPGE